MNSFKVPSGEEALESGIAMLKRAGKSAGSIASDTAKAAVSQTGIPVANDQATQDFVKDLYAPGGKKQNSVNATQAPQGSSQDDTTGSQKSVQEQQDLQALRKKLHDEVYYHKLINPPRQAEERPAEKVEREKQQEMVDLQEREKEKPPPIAVIRAQNSTEQFRGSGG